jgi:hypothetical protein
VIRERKGDLVGQFDDAIADVIGQRSAINEDTSKLVDASVACNRMSIYGLNGGRPTRRLRTAVIWSIARRPVHRSAG